VPKRGIEEVFGRWRRIPNQAGQAPTPPTRKEGYVRLQTFDSPWHSAAPETQQLEWKQHKLGRGQEVGLRTRIRVWSVVLVATLVALLALPAQAHTFYVSCSSSYIPFTFSWSTTSGTHTHSYQWIVSQPNWPAETVLGFQWQNIGPRFGSGHGPGTHSGWYQCG
jgi:hypothetical protein